MKLKQNIISRELLNIFFCSSPRRRESAALNISKKQIPEPIPCQAEDDENGDGIKLRNLKIISALFFILFTFFASFAYGQTAELGGLENTAAGIGYNTQNKQDIVDIVIIIVRALLTLLGAIFFVLIWLGAFDIIGAGGNEEAVAKGKKKIKNGAIGALIILAAYFFTYIVFFIIKNETFKIEAP